MLRIKQLGLIEYQQCWSQMREHILSRQAEDPDELWQLQHPAVYTQGVAGKAEHLINANGIPVVQSDRGGQITYHGPGQLVCYHLLSLRRLGIGVKSLVCQLEQVIINLLSEYGLKGQRQAGAPGVYINNAKIAAIGLRVRHGYCYHGTAFNLNTDLSAFHNINPCGFSDLQVTQLNDLIPIVDTIKVYQQYRRLFKQQFGYSQTVSPHKECIA